RDSDHPETRTKTAHHNPIVTLIAPKDEPCDNNIVTPTNRGAGTDIGQCSNCWVQVVNFHQRNTRCITASADDGCVISRGQRCQNRSFEIICGRNASSLNRGLLSVSPVIVGNRNKGTWTV